MPMLEYLFHRLALIMKKKTTLLCGDVMDVIVYGIRNHKQSTNLCLYDTRTLNSIHQFSSIQNLQSIDLILLAFFLNERPKKNRK